MTNQQLSELLRDKSEEWRAGFFKAVNLTSETKAAFLKLMLHEQVSVVQVGPASPDDVITDHA